MILAGSMATLVYHELLLLPWKNYLRHLIFADCGVMLICRSVTQQLAYAIRPLYAPCELTTISVHFCNSQD
jgi:hypothetical protein